MGALKYPDPAITGRIPLIVLFGEVPAVEANAVAAVPAYVNIAVPPVAATDPEV